MRLPSIVAVIAIFVVGPATSLFAWGPAGHKIIASIAFRQLTTAERTKVLNLLAKHPRFAEDFTQKLPADVASDEALKAEWMFQQAAIWPDIARSFKGEDRKYHHATWHYINEPQFLTETDKDALQSKMKINLETKIPATAQVDMNIIQSIRFARARLHSKSVPDSEKAIALTWLFHCVGDSHQPLHSTAMFSRHLFPTGDRGGNSVATKQRGNLHSLWDGFPGGDIKTTTARNRALEFLAEPQYANLIKSAGKDLDEVTWIQESLRLSREFVYSGEVHKSLEQLEKQGADIKQNPITLSGDYLKSGGQISRGRLVQAGLRLGAVLKQSLGE